MIEQVLIAAVAGGHVLIEGVPGLGKTLLVQTLAHILQLRFSRISVHAHLAPSDLPGDVRGDGNGCRPPHLRVPAGADFRQSGPGGQDQPRAAENPIGLAQAMEGKEINVSTETFHLPQPFFVVGTQNPLEMEGTFPLPEAEIDRFFFKLLVKGPSVYEIDAILQRTTEEAPAELHTTVDGKRMLEMRQIASNVVLARKAAGGLLRSWRPRTPTSHRPPSWSSVTSATAPVTGGPVAGPGGQGACRGGRPVGGSSERLCRGHLARLASPYFAEFRRSGRTSGRSR